MNYDGYHNVRLIPEGRRARIWKVICKHLQGRFIHTDCTILDLGAGYCDFINNIRAKEKHALDIFPELGDHAGGDVEVHIQSCLEFSGILKDHLDWVFCSNLLEHLSRDETDRTLKNIRQSLRSGGRLMLLQPNFKYCFRSYFDDYTHVQVYTHIGLCDYLRVNGFDIEFVKPRFVPFSLKSVPVAPSWAVELYLRFGLSLMGGQMLVVAKKCEEK